VVSIVKNRRFSEAILKMCALRQPVGYPTSKNAVGPHYAK
jgi:hypothetical protein